jgi:hypothetical protein
MRWILRLTVVAWLGLLGTRECAAAAPDARLSALEAEVKALRQEFAALRAEPGKPTGVSAAPRQAGATAPAAAPESRVEPAAPPPAVPQPAPAVPRSIGISDVPIDPAKLEALRTLAAIEWLDQKDTLKKLEENLKKLEEKVTQLEEKLKEANKDKKPNGK